MFFLMRVMGVRMPARLPNHVLNRLPNHILNCKHHHHYHFLHPTTLLFFLFLFAYVGERDATAFATFGFAIV
jgi:hypothetical protein